MQVAPGLGSSARVHSFKADSCLFTCRELIELSNSKGVLQ